MILEAWIVDQEPAQDGRSSPRRASGAILTIATPAQGCRALVFDLSVTGIRLRSSASCAVGDILSVDIPGYPSSRAKVIWKNGDEFGCEFEEPISKAAMSAFILRSPTATDDPLTEEGVVERELGKTVDIDDIAACIERFRMENDDDTCQILGFRIDESGMLIAIIGHAK